MSCFQKTNFHLNQTAVSKDLILPTMIKPQITPSDDTPVKSRVALDGSGISTGHVGTGKVTFGIRTKVLTNDFAESMTLTVTFI